jgi:hypothetical protein
VERLLLAVLLTAVVAALALALRRARPPRSVTVATGPEGWALPQVIDRADLGSPDAATVIVVFTAATCHTCARVWEQVRALPRPGVVAREIEYGSARAFHEKYGIQGVPATAFVDAQGGVQTWLLGPVTDEQLEQALMVTLDASRGVEVRGPRADDTPSS